MKVAAVLLLGTSAFAQSDLCTAGQNAIHDADGVTAGFAAVEASASASLAAMTLGCQKDIIANHSCNRDIDWRDSQGALNKYTDAVMKADKHAKFCSFDCSGTAHWPLTGLSKDSFKVTHVNYMYAASNCTHNDTAAIVAKFSDHIDTFFRVTLAPLLPQMSCVPTDPGCFL